MRNIIVIGPRDTVPDEYTRINTTSRSKRIYRQLSPFIVGPVNLWGGYSSENVENAWQFSKVYSVHCPNGEMDVNLWLSWAQKGWADTWAHRYPMGKGAVPEFSYWDGERLGYIEARKKIYVPLYTKAVKDTTAYKCLRQAFLVKPVALFDFDGYNHRKLGMSLEEVVGCETRKMGHAFVLYAMLMERMDALR